MIGLLFASTQSEATLNAWDRILPYVIPSALALIGVLVGHIFLARKAKRDAIAADEANDTNAFDVVTNRLMELVRKADEDIKAMKVELKEVKSQFAKSEEEKSSLHRELADLHRQNADIQRELSEVRRINVGLGAYVGKLVKAWPVGTILPTPDEPLDFAGIQDLFPRV